MKKLLLSVLFIMLLASAVFADGGADLMNRLAPQDTLSKYFTEKTGVTYSFGCLCTYDVEGNEFLGTRSVDDVWMQNVEPVFTKDVDLVRKALEGVYCLKQEFEHVSLYRVDGEYIFVISDQRDKSVIAPYDFVDKATGEVVARAYNCPDGNYYRLAKDYIADMENRDIVVQKHLTIAERVAQRRERIRLARVNTYAYYNDVGPVPRNIDGGQGEELIDHTVNAGGNMNATSKVRFISSTNNMRTVNIGFNYGGVSLPYYSMDVPVMRYVSIVTTLSDGDSYQVRLSTNSNSGYADFEICDWSGYY